MKEPGLRIVLVNMPFAKVSMPSLAISQLESVLKESFGSRISVEPVYLNMDFVRDVADPAICEHANTGHGMMSGIADWFFRQEAFPGEVDNTDEYMARYYFRDDPETVLIQKLITKYRSSLGGMLDGYIDKYNLLDADIVGFTLFFAQAAASFAMARRLKEHRQDITTVIGGSLCEGDAAKAFAELVPQIDYVFAGPALVSLPEFVRHRLEGENGLCDRIDGVLSKNNKSLWVDNDFSAGETAGSDRINIHGAELDINNNILPDYSAFLDELEDKFPDGSVNPILPFETSRGCGWGEKLQCRFCGMSGIMLQHRVLSPQNAIAQIQSLFKYVPRSSVFASSDNMPPENYFEEVFPLIHPPAGVHIKYHVRPTLSDDDLKILCGAGVTRLNPGIEALSTSTLKLMQKGTSVFKVIRFLMDCSRYPIELEWSILLFSPGESEDVYEKYMRDMPLLSHLCPPASVHPILVARFSEYFNHPEKYGLHLQPQDHYGMTYPFSEEDIRRIAYYFVDGNADSERIEYWIEKLIVPVNEWRNRWYNVDGKGEARLCLLDDTSKPMIYDSRSGNAVEYELNDLAMSVLEYFNKPARRIDAENRFEEQDNSDINNEIDFLLERGLLFEENGRFMSLVID